MLKTGSALALGGRSWLYAHRIGYTPLDRASSAFPDTWDLTGQRERSCPVPATAALSLAVFWIFSVCAISDHIRIVLYNFYFRILFSF